MEKKNDINYDSKIMELSRVVTVISNYCIIRWQV